jgi:hypothetical protein
VGDEAQGRVTEAPAGRARAEVLIETKLHSPAARREWVERRELIGHLAGSAARLVLVDAPAGFGKTTLVAQWLVGISIWPTVEVLLRFAPVLAELGEHAAAVRLLDEARQLLRSLPDGAGASWPAWTGWSGGWPPCPRRRRWTSR